MRKTLELALEALERGETELRWKAITAIKEALAQPEQEPDEVDIRSRLYQRIYELEFARAIEAAHGIK